MASQLIMDERGINTKDMRPSFLQLLSEPQLSAQLSRIGQQLRTQIAQGKVIFPPRHHLFRALSFFELHDTKVVILGQDPYHRRGQAHGLAFSVPTSQTPPPSLKNITCELENDLGIRHRTPPTSLIAWAKQGVLLLNTTLTTEEAQPGSHQHLGWDRITSAIVSAISQRCEGVVFMLWGRHAQQAAGSVDQAKHCVISSAHPSPLSAHRGFLGSRPFSKTDAYLDKRGLTIHWQLET